MVAEEVDVGLATVGTAAGMFSVTNIDDIVILALFFGQAGGRRAGIVRIAVGQYLGFAAILIASVLAALGAGLLPETVLPYLGLLPLLLGIRAAWGVWRPGHGDESTEASNRSATGTHGAPGAVAVAGVTFANGGDNIGVYVPVFATATTAGLTTYCVVFLVMVGLWCLLGHFFATRPLVASALSRWGHVLLPVVLIGLGLLILVQGGAFRL